MFFKKLIEKYNDRYRIPYMDLADAGESNRIVLHFASIIIFFVELAGLTSIIIMHFSELTEQKDSYIYYGSFLIISVLAFFVTRQNRDYDRSRAYIYKTIPLYIVMYAVFGMSVYNCILGSVFNGFLTFCLTVIIGLCTCSFSPMIFLTGLLIAIGGMSPAIYQAFGFSGLMNAIITVLLMFCLSLYKRRIEKKHIQFLKKQKQSFEAKTFGNFTLMYENKVVKFARTKSQEMMAYLIYKKGSSVKTKELIFVLYGRDADSARYGSNIRNLVSDIKHTLGELQIQNFFLTEYNNFRINPDIIKCDYYDFLAGDKTTIKSYTGEFLNQYHWAEEAASYLGMKALEK